jgi:phage terminase large subunit
MEQAKQRVWIPPKLQFLLTKKARYKVAYGGRGGAKSRSFALAAILLSYSYKVRIV